MTFPKAYSSAFRDACFVLGGVRAPLGVDIEIRATGQSEALGVKRIYASGAASVNVTPYLRGLFSVVPLCGRGSGATSAVGRVVSCYLSATGFSSAAVNFCCGTEDATLNSVLSAAPAMLKIAPGEIDELSIVTGGAIAQPLVTFSHGGVEYRDETFGALIGSEMATFVIDVDAIAERFASLTGAAAHEMTGFTAGIRSGDLFSDILPEIPKAGSTPAEEAAIGEAPAEDALSGIAMQGSYVSRRYLVERGAKGRRLAWVNRYGAVDYHTFPVEAESRITGSRTRIDTPDGYRTVATAAERSLTLLSEPCDDATADWLAEIFSSPAVWLVQGSDFEKVEVSAGQAICSPLKPTTVSVTVSPALKPVSRKF